MRLEPSELQLKAMIMDKLMKRNCWGAKYHPVDTLVNWLGKNIKRNGKRVRKYIDQLVREGYLLRHKKGETISLNPHRSNKIRETLLRNL